VSRAAIGFSGLLALLKTNTVAGTDDARFDMTN